MLEQKERAEQLERLRGAKLKANEEQHIEQLEAKRGLVPSQ
jgi:hypothetical protein